MKALLLRHFAIVSTTCALFFAQHANAASGNKLQTYSGTTAQSPDFQGYGGTSTLIGNGCALLDTMTIVTDKGAFAGVYISPSLPGKPLGTLSRLSFAYHVAAGSGAALYIAIPIDVNGDGQYDAFAFIRSTGCNDPSAPDGVVNLNCPVEFDARYENWAAFATAHPDYRFGADTEPFIHDGGPFIGTVCDVQFGRASAK
jgi:hypothetical protein